MSEPLLYYILNEDHSITVSEDILKWAQSFESQNRIVAKTHIGNVNVSTVFLGLDHRFGDEGPPLIFETMIFGGTYDEAQYRTSTYEEAQAVHATAVRKVKTTAYGRWIGFLDFLIVLLTGTKP